MTSVPFMPSSGIALLGWGALACLACAAILFALIRTGLAWRLATDIPNDRSLHTRPTPRVGGWGIVPVVAVLIACLAPSLWLPVLATVLLAMLSQVDDRRGLSARVRFGAHALAVVALIVCYPMPIGWWALAIMAVLLVWLVNLYNFMDGSDGLAGGMALFGFGGYAIAAWSGPHPDASLAVAATIVAGAATGFLLFNFHPARVFLGDAGSIPLGYLAGALGYWGWREGVWPVWFPAMCFAPFIGDASATLARRLLRGEKFWQAHREHYYQRMVQTGLGHARTAWIWYAAMAIGIIVANYVTHLNTLYQWLTVVAWAVVLVLAGLGVDRRWRRYLSHSRQSRDSTQ